MSKRAGAVPEETKAKLISAAREEFHQFGYEKASLRNICKNAGVTTGALYFFFRNKEDFFEEVLSPITKVVNRMGKDFTPILLENDYTSMEHFVDFYYSNIILYEIIWNNQNNKFVQNYLSNIQSTFYSEVINLVDYYCSVGKVVKLIDNQTIKWAIDMLYLSVLRLVTLNLEKEKAKQHIVTVVKILRDASFGLT